MKQLAKEQRFEEATVIRNRVYFLEHIQDVAILKREDDEVDRIKMGEAVVNLYGRIEGYDISHISGTNTVASMVVFENGAPAKAEYRKFRIRSVDGPNDVGSMKETLMRRFRHEEWSRPDLLLIDGGVAQVQAAEEVVHHFGLGIPVVGIAKGPERKRNDVVCSRQNMELCLLCEKHIDLLASVRDEAHRFGITYHRQLRRRNSLPLK